MNYVNIAFSISKILIEKTNLFFDWNMDNGHTLALTCMYSLSDEELPTDIVILKDINDNKYKLRYNCENPCTFESDDINEIINHINTAILKKDNI